MSDAPPIGLKPKNITRYEYARQRLIEIHEAMIRYLRAGQPISDSWFQEFDELHVEVEAYHRQMDADDVKRKKGVKG